MKTSIDWGLALAIPPFLGTLRLAETLGVELQTLGEWSEELFRGQRLPVLPFPDTDPPPSVPWPAPANKNFPIC